MTESRISCKIKVFCHRRIQQRLSAIFKPPLDNGQVFEGWMRSASTRSPILTSRPSSIWVTSVSAPAVQLGLGKDKIMDLAMQTLEIVLVMDKDSLESGSFNVPLHHFSDWTPEATESGIESIQTTRRQGFQSLFSGLSASRRHWGLQEMPCSSRENSGGHRAYIAKTMAFC